MEPKATTQRGKPCFTIDARSQGHGRIYAPTKADCWTKYNKLVAEAGNGQAVQFTAEDGLAKIKLGDRGTLSEAVECFLARVVKEKMTVVAAGDAWCAEMRSLGKISEDYIKICEVVMRAFVLYCDQPGSGIRFVSDVTSDFVLKFLLSKNHSAGYRNTIRARLGQFFTFCQQRNAMPKGDSNHPIKEQKVKKFGEGRGRKAPRIFTVDECRRLLASAQEQFPIMIPYLALGLFCGVRPALKSEMGRLVAADIHLKAGELEIPDGTTKCGPGRTVRLTQKVSRFVQRPDGTMIDNPMIYSPALAWLKIAPEPLAIFCTNHFRRALCQAAGVTWSPDVMRHTFASNHFYAFRNDTDTREQMGHTGGLEMLKKHYLNRAAEKDALAFWSLLPEPASNVVALPTEEEIPLAQSV